MSFGPTFRPFLEALESRQLLSAANQLLIRSYYQDALGRPASDGEVGFWAAPLDAGTAQASVAQAMVGSQEFNDQVVGHLFTSYLGRTVDSSGLSYFGGALASGTTTLAGMKAAILGSDEYFQTVGKSNNTTFVSAVYGSVLGRSVDPSGAANWGSALAAGVSRQHVAESILASTEGLSGTVQGLYQTLLGRAGDAGGVAGWVARMQQGESYAAMVVGFLASQEYFNKATLVTPPAQLPLPTDAPLFPKVMVIAYDPILHTLGNERLHQLNGQDPLPYLPRAVAKFQQYSYGVVNYQIVETDILDAWPQQADGFQYDESTFLHDYNARTPHLGSVFDYNKTFADLNVASKINSGAVDEVWLFTGNTDYFRTWESTMAGPGAYWVNSPPVQNVATNRGFITMGFNFERLAVGELGHGYGHRIESIMEHHVYGLWDRQNPSANNWSKFADINKDAPGQAGIGNIHFPPNGLVDYDYNNTAPVVSSAPDWMNYPYFKGTTTVVTNATWVAPGQDPQSGYLDWWYSHFPHFTGRGPDGKLNDWWRYVIDPNLPA